MIQRVLNSKNFLAVLLALLTGTALYFKMPWPVTASFLPQTWNEYFLRLIALRDPWTYAGLKASFHVMLFTTPYIGYSFLLSTLYIFTLRPRRSPKPQPLPLYPVVESRNQLSVVIGEIHNPRLPIPAENPSWLIIPERGLFTGTIMIGATGSGKTAGGMYPFTDQLLGYRAVDADAKASAQVLESKMRMAGENILGKSFLTVSRESFQSYARELTDVGFEADESGQQYRVLDSAAARDVLQKLAVEPTVQHESSPSGIDQDRKEQLEAVKRWYNDDWKNLDKKLQSSVVEGISVFLSLFDDNPRVKRMFCPPLELYRQPE